MEPVLACRFEEKNTLTKYRYYLREIARLAEASCVADGRKILGGSKCCVYVFRFASHGR